MKKLILGCLLASFVAFGCHEGKDVVKDCCKPCHRVPKNDKTYWMGFKNKEGNWKRYNGHQFTVDAIFSAYVDSTNSAYSYEPKEGYKKDMLMTISCNSTTEFNEELWFHENNIEGPLSVRYDGGKGYFTFARNNVQFMEGNKPLKF